MLFVHVLIFFINYLVLACSAEDTSEINCSELAKQGRCLSETDFMKKHCQDACFRWKQEIEKVRVEYIDEDQPSFFALRAQNSTGHLIKFERFEGVLTLVTILMKSCESNDTIEATYKSMEALRDVWQYGLEIIIFHFEHPSIDYSQYDCKHFDAVHKTPRTKLHIMELTKINGPETNTVLKYLKNIFHMEELDGNFAPFFFINPDGNKIEFHRGASFESLKQYIKRNLDQDYEL